MVLLLISKILQYSRLAVPTEFWGRNPASCETLSENSASLLRSGFQMRQTAPRVGGFRGPAPSHTPRPQFVKAKEWILSFRLKQESEKFREFCPSNPDIS